MDQDYRVGIFVAHEQAAARGEGAGLAGVGAAGELLYASAGYELLDAVAVADAVDPGYCRAVLEGLQGVVEGRPAAQVYELLRLAHPAAGPTGEHERDGRAVEGTRDG